MSESMELAPKRKSGIGSEQEVWAVAADQIKASDLEGGDRDALRAWISQQMISTPARVWEDIGGAYPKVRPSFRTAVRIAAERIVAGEPLA